MPDEGVIGVPADFAKFLTDQVLQHISAADKHVIDSSVDEINKRLDDGEDPTVAAIEISRGWADDCVLTQFLDKLNGETEKSLRITCANFQNKYGDDWRKELNEYLHKLMVSVFFCIKSHKVDFDNLGS